MNPNSGPAGPGEGNPNNTSESQSETSTPSGFGLYTSRVQIRESGRNGEIWNGDSGVGGLGHTVCIVGYTKDANGNVTDLICHDDWPTTVRDVQVAVIQAGAVFFPLDAITTLVPEPGSGPCRINAVLAMAGWARLAHAGKTRQKTRRPAVIKGLQPFARADGFRYSLIGGGSAVLAQCATASQKQCLSQVGGTALLLRSSGTRC